MIRQTAQVQFYSMQPISVIGFHYWICYDSHPVWIKRITFDVLIKDSSCWWGCMSQWLVLTALSLSRVKLTCCSFVPGSYDVPNGWQRLMKAPVPFFTDVSRSPGGSMSKSRFALIYMAGFLKGILNIFCERKFDSQALFLSEGFG